MCSQEKNITTRIMNAVGITLSTSLLTQTSNLQSISQAGVQTLNVTFGNQCKISNSNFFFENFFQSNIQIWTQSSTTVDNQVVQDITTKITNEVENLIQEFLDPITAFAESIGSSTDNIITQIRNAVNVELNNSVTTQNFNQNFASTFGNQTLNVSFGDFCEFSGATFDLRNTLVYEAKLTSILSTSVKNVLNQTVFTGIDNFVKNTISTVSILGIVFGIIAAVLIIVGVIFLVKFLKCYANPIGCAKDKLFGKSSDKQLKRANTDRKVRDKIRKELENDLKKQNKSLAKEKEEFKKQLNEYASKSGVKFENEDTINKIFQEPEVKS
jgi:hypothetical protein